MKGGWNTWVSIPLESLLWMSFPQYSWCLELMANGSCSNDRLSWTQLSKSKARKCRNTSWFARSTMPFSSLEYAVAKDSSIPHSHKSSGTHSLWKVSPWSVWMTNMMKYNRCYFKSCCWFGGEELRPSGKIINDNKDVFIWFRWRTSNTMRKWRDES
jgi:hypothetical protein